MIYHRVIVNRVQFIHHHFFGMANGIVNWPQHLGNTTQRIIFLHFILKHFLVKLFGVVQMFGAAADHFTVF